MVLILCLNWLELLLAAVVALVVAVMQLNQVVQVVVVLIVLPLAVLALSARETMEAMELVGVQVRSLTKLVVVEVVQVPPETRRVMEETDYLLMESFLQAAAAEIKEILMRTMGLAASVAVVMVAAHRPPTVMLIQAVVVVVQSQELLAMAGLVLYCLEPQIQLQNLPPRVHRQSLFQMDSENTNSQAQEV
jgi:hypothetical protein